MEGLLTPVSQNYRKSSQRDELFKISEPAGSVPKTQIEFGSSSPEEALEALKSQPSYDLLLSVLKYLQKGLRGNHSFDIRKPTPQSAQIIYVLVTEIVPNFWTVLQDASTGRSKGDLHVLVSCLRSLAGTNAVVAYLRALLKEAKLDSKSLKNSRVSFNLSFILELLAHLLGSHDDIKYIWSNAGSLGSPTQIRLIRQELVSLFTSGKIISLSAEAEDVCRQAGQLKAEVWIGNVKLYIDWLAQNIVQWVGSGVNKAELGVCADILTRGMRLGHSESLINTLITGLLLRNVESRETFENLLGSLPPLEQRKVLNLTLKLLSDKYLGSIHGTSEIKDASVIQATSGVLKVIVGNDETRKNHLLNWLTSGSGAGIGEGYGIRRAAVAVFSDDKEFITTVLEKSLSQFGDKLYIKHAPLLQQDAHAQVLLLSAGYVHRLAPIKLTILLRSSVYLNAVSNRIASSQTRARFLGMVVGEALSGLVHGKEVKLDFKMDEMDTEEAKWYKSLVQMSDKPGPLDPLRETDILPKPSNAPKITKPSVAPAQRAGKPPLQSGFIIEEIQDDEDEDPDLVPYVKPDSDAEDSDDDPTLINRDKPKAPVYVRDLITYFRDLENYDRQKLALTTAPTLIRKKANYGTEVSSHAEELATLLVGLQDKYELDNFDDLRLQGMIAIVVAQPKKMGQWFAKTFFDGDYSLSQRASVLMVLGLSGREIAGFEVSEYGSTTQFPSKMLPAKVERYYAASSPSNRLEPGARNLKALPPNALDSLAKSLSQTFLAPLAAEAADSVTGPDALKLSSFTSRLQQSQSSNPGKSKAKPRIRAIPNTTASLIASSFFFPLTSRFQAAMRSASATTRGILFQPYLLALYLKTLAILLHAAGPSTLALPQMTSEFWDLLLGVRGQCVGDLSITQAVLFGLVALLDVNENDMRGLCERQGREVVESVEWVSAVFNNTRGGDVGGGGGGGGGGEENEVKMLAAGVLIRLREAVDKYQAVLMGDLIGFA
ncbi:telomere length regulation protein-domain-containing protein [Daldinia grandis]|nr:telomere length regulation protein-domain-containing protein [Daldinia grandis]